MKLKSFVTGLAALALVATPTLASAAPTAAPQPAKEQVAGDNEFFGHGGGGIIAILALLAIIAGILAATSGHNRPTSP